MPFFRKKPVVIEAMQWDGTAQGATPIIDWVLAGGGTATYRNSYLSMSEGRVPARLAVRTLEGTMYASPGDWVIKGVQGEFYPCKPDIFEATYDPVVPVPHDDVVHSWDRDGKCDHDGQYHE